MSESKMDNSVLVMRSILLKFGLPNVWLSSLHAVSFLWIIMSDKLKQLTLSIHRLLIHALRKLSEFDIQIG